VKDNCIWTVVNIHIFKKSKAAVQSGKPHQESNIMRKDFGTGATERQAFNSSVSFHQKI
jgi:hypothetical protein